MYGVGDVTAAQLIAEIGDVRRFAHRSSLVAFAGVDPAVNPVGQARRTEQSGHQTRLSTSAQDPLPGGLHLSEKVPGQRAGVPVSGQETRRGQALFRVHDRRTEQVPAHLLRTGERVPHGGWL